MANSLPLRPDKSSKDNRLCQTGIRYAHLTLHLMIGVYIVYVVHSRLSVVAVFCCVV